MWWVELFGNIGIVVVFFLAIAAIASLDDLH